MLSWNVIIAVILFIYGTLLGSFVNAWVWRTRHDKKINKGRSICPHCKHKLSARDLVPVLSYMLLGGKCRYCKKKVSAQYPIVELIAGGLFAGLYVAINPHDLLSWLLLALWLGLTVFMLADATYDALWYELPLKFTIPAVGLAIAIFIVDGVRLGSAITQQKFFVTVAFSGFFYILWFVSKGKWMGDGDIGLAAIMGMVLTPVSLVVAALAAFNAGAVVSLGLIASGLKTRRDIIAFGPFLIGGMYFGLFFGSALAGWYTRLWLW